VVAVHAGMRKPREGGETRAMGGEEIKVGTGGPTLHGEEKLRHHPQGHMDREEPARRQGLGGPTHRRESEAGAGGAEEMTAIHEGGIWQGNGDKGMQNEKSEGFPRHHSLVLHLG
jgi:hypothetical protein